MNTGKCGHMRKYGENKLILLSDTLKIVFIKSAGSTATLYYYRLFFEAWTNQVGEEKSNKKAYSKDHFNLFFFSPFFSFSTFICYVRSLVLISILFIFSTYVWSIWKLFVCCMCTLRTTTKIKSIPWCIKVCSVCDANIVRLVRDECTFGIALHWFRI